MSSEPYPYRIPWQKWQQSWQEMQSSEPRLLISIDWDFFFQLPDLSLLPDQEAEKLAVAIEFGIDEWFSQQRAEREWQEIANRIETLGYSSDELFSFAPDMNPQTFAQQLKTLFSVENCFIADSHAWGTWFCGRAYHASNQVGRLLSFDAHHDCGYFNYRGDTPLRSQKRAKSRPSCDDWIHSSLVHGLLSEAEIIYPDWNGLDEWERQPNSLPEEYYLQARPTTYRNWLANYHQAEQKSVDLLIVRSSSWTPQFLNKDNEFLRFVDYFSPWRCLDCLAPEGISIGSFDGCQARNILASQH